MANTPYVPPDLCTGTWRIGEDDPCSQNDGKTAEGYAAEALEISGALINVFKLLGVHEQGLLIDLTGSGYPLSSGSAGGSNVANAFDATPATWTSSQVGSAVTSAPAYLGYYFGTKKTSMNTEKYAPPQPIMQHITTVKIQQGALAANRVLQARIERATGALTMSSVGFTGTGNGTLTNSKLGFKPSAGQILIVATSPTTFDVMSSSTGPLGTATVGTAFGSNSIVFTINVGTIPFVIGDTFSITLGLDWKRVDVVNLPNTANLETINVRPSSPAPYWRIVPLMFAGTASDSWEVNKLELLDYQATSIDNIEDTLFLENRDRDYSQISIPLKAHYSPFDAVGDLGKFGISILDQYIFTVSFAKMVELLGRPIIVGDVIEVTPELQYDQHLLPVKKYLEVTEAGWAAEGFTPGWRPVLYRFQAQQLLPSAEHKDLFGTPEQQKYAVDDSTFFAGIGQLETTPLTVTEDLGQQAVDAVPERGQDPQEIASGIPKIPTKIPGGIGEYDGRDTYIEDGLPPDGLPYGEGYKLPELTAAADGDYFRLNYPINLKIPPRLYRFSLYKNKWLYLETDRREEYISHKPSIAKIMRSPTRRSLKDV